MMFIEELDEDVKLSNSFEAAAKLLKHTSDGELDSQAVNELEEDVKFEKGLNSQAAAELEDVKFEKGLDSQVAAEFEDVKFEKGLDSQAVAEFKDVKFEKGLDSQAVIELEEDVKFEKGLDSQAVIELEEDVKFEKGLDSQAVAELEEDVKFEKGLDSQAVAELDDVQVENGLDSQAVAELDEDIKFEIVRDSQPVAELDDVKFVKCVDSQSVAELEEDIKFERRLDSQAVGELENVTHKDYLNKPVVPDSQKHVSFNEELNLQIGSACEEDLNLNVVSEPPIDTEFDEELNLHVASESQKDTEFDEELRLQAASEEDGKNTSVLQKDDLDEITLQAIAELEKDAMRAKERSSSMGVSGWRQRTLCTNRKYLHNTLIGTMQTNRRIDTKLKVQSRHDESPKKKHVCSKQSRTNLHTTILGNIQSNKIIDQKYKRSNKDQEIQKSPTNVTSNSDSDEELSKLDSNSKNSKPTNQSDCDEIPSKKHISSEKEQNYESNIDNVQSNRSKKSKNNIVTGASHKKCDIDTEISELNKRTTQTHSVDIELSKQNVCTKNSQNYLRNAVIENVQSNKIIDQKLKLKSNILTDSKHRKSKNGTQVTKLSKEFKKLKGKKHSAIDGELSRPSMGSNISNRSGSDEESSKLYLHTSDEESSKVHVQKKKKERRKRSRSSSDEGSSRRARSKSRKSVKPTHSFRNEELSKEVMNVKKLTNRCEHDKLANVVFTSKRTVMKKPSRLFNIALSGIKSQSDKSDSLHKRDTCSNIRTKSQKQDVDRPHRVRKKSHSDDGS